MNRMRNSGLTRISRLLRKHMTKEEKHLWYDFLKKLPQTVNRQKIIGKYVVDFYCASAKLVIELDGSQHESTMGKIADAERDAYLKEQGLIVLRYSNYDIHRSFSHVCDDILWHLNAASVDLSSE